MLSAQGLIAQWALVALIFEQVATFAYCRTTRSLSSMPENPQIPQLHALTTHVDTIAPKVQLELYMETMCPYCARFVKSLNDVIEDGFADKVDLSFVPWVRHPK